jgi:hypothetical protein
MTDIEKLLIILTLCPVCCLGVIQTYDSRLGYFCVILYMVVLVLEIISFAKAMILRNL